MTVTDDQPAQPTVLDTPVEENTGSVWGALKRQHKEVSGQRDPLYLDDPVHEGIVYRYKYVPLEDTKAATKRLEKIRDKTVLTIASAIETLILTLDEIMVTHPDGEIPLGRNGQPLHTHPLKALAGDGEPPICFDERLCAGMDFPAKVAERAHRIVREMFTGNGYLIIQHAQEVTEWITSTGVELRDEFAEDLQKGR